MSLATTETYSIPTGSGRLHAQRWRPTQSESGAPIVLLHDSLGCVALWRDFPSRLAQATGRSVIAYDRLGFGRSDPHPARLDKTFVHAEARQGFAALREALALERFVVFGHSVGGGMAVGCAAAYPDDCVALITESAQAFVEDRTVAGIQAARATFAEPGQLERLSKYHGDKAAWVLSAWIDTWLADDFAHWSLDDHLRQVRCPVLALHGELDEYGSHRHPERIAALSTGPATLRLLPGCGHVPHKEREAQVLAMVERWLGDGYVLADDAA
ncbi:alpha/beta fold hydrolase [Lysobacter silvisoli]|uniref:Alpha/beta hydrolase n=1 Tax=Lysobacter silvisoli TaxID=2293254 RepID=A0A371K4Q8_9GAMM|nr:alpha/beta hydrolase [Lysobacter silvisoli]RDZ28923.1 alpha/beta hydrolase [Lysobacter silvisoli]